MKYLHNDWRFRPDGKGGSIDDFNVEFAFRNRMLDTLAGRFFDEALRKMVKAFEARANKLYAAGAGSGDGASGSSSSSAHSAACRRISWRPRSSKVWRSGITYIGSAPPTAAGNN